MSVACPKCGEVDNTELIEKIPAVKDIPARLVLRCLTCKIPFYVRDDASDSD